MSIPAGLFLNPARVDGSIALDVDHIPNPLVPGEFISILEFPFYYPSAPQSIQTALGTVETQWALQAGADFDFLAYTLYGVAREYANYAAYFASTNGPGQKCANSFGMTGGYTWRAITYVPNKAWIP